MGSIGARVSKGEDILYRALLSMDRRIWRLAYSYVRNVEDAQDLSQDIRLKVLEKGGGFLGDSSAETWIFRVAINACRDYARKGARRSASEVELVEELHSPGEDRAMAIALGIAMEGLPPRQRQLLSLREFGGLAYREIAQVLGLSIGSVESGIFDARRSLAVRLGVAEGGMDGTESG